MVYQRAAFSIRERLFKFVSANTTQILFLETLTFARLTLIGGNVNNSYRKTAKSFLKNIMATELKKSIIYIHGKGGSANEAEHFRPLFPECDVIGLNYSSNTPWEAKEEFRNLFKAYRKRYSSVTIIAKKAPMLFAIIVTEEYRKRYSSVTIIANSIGAFFAMSSLSEVFVDKAYFVSPVVDMQKLIYDMMKSAHVTEEELYKKSKIATDFGETLSWEYLCYVKDNPIRWTVPTCILYGENDRLTSQETISDFAKKIGAKLTVMKNGEHWFHTDEQMRFVDDWIKSATNQSALT